MKSKQQNDKLPINIVTAGKAAGTVAVGTYTTGGAALGSLIGVIVGTVGSPAVGLYTESLAGAGFGVAGGGTAVCSSWTCCCN